MAPYWILEKNIGLNFKGLRVKRGPKRAPKRHPENGPNGKMPLNWGPVCQSCRHHSHLSWVPFNINPTAAAAPAARRQAAANFFLSPSSLSCRPPGRQKRGEREREREREKRRTNPTGKKSSPSFFSGRDWLCPFHWGSRLRLWKLTFLRLSPKLNFYSFSWLEISIDLCWLIHNIKTLVGFLLL